MLRFKRAIDRTNEVIGLIVGPIILISIAILLYEIVMRYLFNSPTIWVNDLVQILFGFYFLLGGGYTLLHNGHVRVDVLLTALSERPRRTVILIATIITLPFLFVLLWLSGDQAWVSISYMERAESAWAPYIFPVIAAAPVAAALMILQTFANIIRDAKGEDGGTTTQEEVEHSALADAAVSARSTAASKGA